MEEKVFLVVKDVLSSFDVLLKQEVMFVTKCYDKAEKKMEECKSIDKKFIDSFVFDVEDYLGIVSFLFVKDSNEEVKKLVKELFIDDIYFIPKNNKYNEVAKRIYVTLKNKDCHDFLKRQWFSERRMNDIINKYKHITMKQILHLLKKYENYRDNYFDKNIEYKILESSLID